MEKIKTIVDREQLSSNYIGSNQNFGHVLSQVKNLKPPVWKTAWFYGHIGLSAIVIIVSLASINATGNYEKDNSSLIAKEEIIGTEKSTKEDNVDSPIEPENTLSSSLNASDPVTDPPINEITVTTVINERNGSNPIADETAITPKKNMFPNIEGVYTGNINLKTLCSDNGIQCNDEINIISFTIQYSLGLQDRLTKVKGNKIPNEICGKIQAQNGANMIFITEIKGLRDNGELINLTSINYLASK